MRKNVCKTASFADIFHKFRLIGQKELVKTAITLENSMCIAVLSCLKQDIPWTKRVGKICGNS